jgi:vacuolar-type H+-ATPase subunit F/Vma7
MSSVVAIGEEQQVAPFAMVGVAVIAVDKAAAVSRAWASLGDDVGLVILTRRAATALGPALRSAGGPLWTVMP